MPQDSDEQGKRPEIDEDKVETLYSLTGRECELIVFALGRCYALCQLLADEALGHYMKREFIELAEKFGAKT